MRRALCLLCILMLLCGVSLAEDGQGAPAASGVTYEIFVGSFADADGDDCGDLQGIISRLDYLEKLGISRIWLTPIHPSPSYHHYDVTDYYAVAPEFGTIEDFDQLVSECAARGIDVMIDLVVNHTSSEHPWFRAACEALRSGVDSEYLSWYNFTEGSGAYVVTDTNWYYEGSFGYHMPDLNLDSEDVRQEVANIIAFWQEHGVKGFRLDAVTSYYTGASGTSADFVRFLCETARQNDPDCYLVGEVWDTEQTVMALYQSGIDSLFNFPAADQKGVLIQGALNGRGVGVANFLAQYNAKLREASPNSMDAPFLTNHDIARVRGMLRSDVTKMKTAAMLYLLLPGRPVVYYGEELGMGGSGADENKRLPMLWSATDESQLCSPPENASQAQKLKAGVDEQDADPDSLLNTYRSLIALRKLAPELERGTMTALDGGNDALCCFAVEDAGSTVIVLINASPSESFQVDTMEFMLQLEGALGSRVLGSVGNVQTEGDWLSPLRSDTPTATVVSLSPVSCLLLRVEQ